MFGGGHVLDLAESRDSVPQRNIVFVREFLRAEGFPVAAEDLGGRSARLVHFDTDSGRAFVKRLGGATRPEVFAREREIARPAPAPPAYGEVTLF